MDRDQILNPCDVDNLIADGQVIVIYEDAVLRLDGWMDRHPGGRLAVLHMVGRDATDEMKSYHSKQTLKTMKAYRIGRKQGTWVNRTPPIRGGVFVKANPIVDGSSSSETEDDSADDGVSQISSLCNCGISHKDAKEGLRHRGPCPTQTQGPNQKPSAHIQVANAALEQEIQNDLTIYPSLDPLVQKEIARKYQILHQQITDAGLYDCPYIDYGKEAVRYTLLFTSFIVLLNYGWYLTSAIFLGLFWHQLMFTAHDGGHLAITANFVVDTLIAMFVADFCCGLSIGWWKSSHNVHHLVTNYPEHDPDIQNVPIFATSPAFFKSIHSSYYDFTFIWDAAADFLVPYQKYTYYPIMGVARFNLYLLSWLHVISNRSSGLSFSKAWWIRPTEIVFMGCYWFLFGYCLLWKTLPDWPTRIGFVLVSHIVTMPLHVQITLSHWGTSHADLGETESFPQRQLRTTMDVDCPAWLDFIHGGLQFQAVHHLFPRLPRHNLRKAQVFTKEFCRETGVPYSILTFVKGNQKVLGRLHDIGEQVQVLVDCQKHMAKTGESGLA
ncbi:fatty acid desaturase-domain-containing protein [Ilyonectria sp. MPI-CAGE-AT-0026]|nr:fatty acid desaturase-domain-containing protein [Ilyonectria sp. MPI-CAGE-AT-0026]